MFPSFPGQWKKQICNSRVKVNLRNYYFQIRKFKFINFSVKGNNMCADITFRVTKNHCLWYIIMIFFHLFFLREQK